MKTQLNSLNQPVTPVDRWVVNPLKRFMHNNVMGGIVLFASAFLAVFLANSPWSHEFHQLWELKFSLGFNGYTIDKSLHHWINDGLMAVFFFVVGLELKERSLRAN
jgi:NhaA family Na+:H+ antiporter